MNTVSKWLISSAGRVAALSAGAWRRHVDAQCAEDLRPECNGEAGQDHDEGANEGLETRTAGRIVVARTVDTCHYSGVSQNERRPRALLASPKRRRSAIFATLLFASVEV